MPTSSRVQKYELTFILGEKATQEAAVKKTEELKKYLVSLGGEVEKEELWGRRELAYIIKRNRSGFYVTVWFTLPANQVRPLEEHLYFDESVIRSLVTKAYKNAQPGTLYPVKEEPDKPETAEPEKDHASAEESLRRSSTPVAKKDEEEFVEDMPEEERLKKLEATLDEILKDDKEVQE